MTILRNEFIMLGTLQIINLDILKTQKEEVIEMRDAELPVLTMLTIATSASQSFADRLQEVLRQINKTNCTRLKVLILSYACETVREQPF